jgi:hypothetical protein
MSRVVGPFYRLITFLPYPWYKLRYFNACSFLRADIDSIEVKKMNRGKKNSRDSRRDTPAEVGLPHDGSIRAPRRKLGDFRAEEVIESDYFGRGAINKEGKIPHTEGIIQPNIPRPADYDAIGGTDSDADAEGEMDAEFEANQELGFEVYALGGPGSDLDAEGETDSELETNQERVLEAHALEEPDDSDDTDFSSDGTTPGEHDSDYEQDLESGNSDMDSYGFKVDAERRMNNELDSDSDVTSTGEMDSDYKDSSTGIDSEIHTENGTDPEGHAGAGADDESDCQSKTDDEDDFISEHGPDSDSSTGTPSTQCLDYEGNLKSG